VKKCGAPAVRRGGFTREKDVSAGKKRKKNRREKPRQKTEELKWCTLMQAIGLIIK